MAKIKTRVSPVAPGVFKPTEQIRKQVTESKIIFVDVETAPSLGWVWGKWEQNVIDFQEDGYLLSFSVKEAGVDKKPVVRGLMDYASWDGTKFPRAHSDRDLVNDLWGYLNEADIVVAHNGDRFDVPQINTRFLTHGIQPPKPFRTIDTLRVARKVFGFKSNKLDDLSRDLKLGRKTHHTGSSLWFSCMQGDLQAWKTMKEYNAHDVCLLEQLYYQFLPWIPVQTNVNRSGTFKCPRCGSDQIRLDGFQCTALRRKDQFHCFNCSGWFTGSAKKF